jgi:hypothetical protein
MVFPAKTALTPAGSPFAPETPSLAMPVARVVAWVIGVRAVLIQRVGVEEARPAVFITPIVAVTDVLSLSQPLVVL